MRIVGGVRHHFVTRLPEWLLACEMMIEGLQLVRTGKTFGSAHAYKVIAAMVREEPWGWLGVCVAAAWLVALFLNGTFVAFRRVSPWARSLSALVAALYWGVWTITMAIASPVGTGFINHAGYSALAAAYSIIVMREVGVADERARKCRSRKLRIG